MKKEGMMTAKKRKQRPRPPKKANRHSTASVILRNDYDASTGCFAGLLPQGSFVFTWLDWLLTHSLKTWQVEKEVYGFCSLNIWCYDAFYWVVVVGFGSCCFCYIPYASCIYGLGVGFGKEISLLLSEYSLEFPIHVTQHALERHREHRVEAISRWKRCRPKPVLVPL